MISRNRRAISSLRSGPAIALERLAQHLRLALGTVEIDRLAARGLRDADLLREAGTLVQQARECAHRWRRCCVADAAEIAARRGAFAGAPAPTRAPAAGAPRGGRVRSPLRIFRAFPACSCVLTRACARIRA